MTIQVISTSDVKEPANEQVKETKVEQSAPDNSEQNTTESDPEEKEVKEEDKDESEESEENDAKDEEKEKPRRKSGFQRRIDKLNARNTAAQEELEYWKEQALKGASESKKEPVESKPVAVEGKPIADNFETHAEYIEALTDWKLEQRDQKLEKSKLLTEQENKLKSYSERAKDFSKKNSDFDDVLAEVDDIPLSPSIHEMILSSENGPELAYELAKNRAEYERLNKLAPLAAARELGKIEFKLFQAKESKQEPKKTTKAPEPITPVGSKGGSIEKSLDDPNISQADYERIRREQIKRKNA